MYNIKQICKNNCKMYNKYYTNNACILHSLWACPSVHMDLPIHSQRLGQTKEYGNCNNQQTGQMLGHLIIGHRKPFCFMPVDVYLIRGVYRDCSVYCCVLFVMSSPLYTQLLWPNANI